MFKCFLIVFNIVDNGKLVGDIKVYERFIHKKNGRVVK